MGLQRVALAQVHSDLLRRKHDLDAGAPLVDELKHVFGSPDEEVLSQLETQPTTWPRTTSGLEGILTQVDNSIAYRRAGLRQRRAHQPPGSSAAPEAHLRR